MSTLFFDGLFLIMLTIMRILGLSNSVSSLAESDKGSSRLCKSEECITMSENFLSKMNQSVDPCLDFYSYSCGKYTEINAQNEIEKSLLRATKHLMEMIKEKSKDDHRTLKIIKEMLKFCIQHKSNIEDLRKMITYLGEWSLLDPNWKEKDFSLIKFYSKCMEVGYLPKSLFAIDIEMNPANRKNMIAIKPRIESGTGLLKEVSQSLRRLDLAARDEEFVKYFKTYFIPKLADKMNITKMKLEKELLEFNRISEGLKIAYGMPKEPALMNIGTVKATWPHIPLIEILNAVFNSINIKISKNDTIYIDCPKCLNSLDIIISKISIKSLATYVMVSFVFDNIMDADDEMITQWLELQEVENKEKYCANKIFGLFRRVIDYEYYKRYYDKGLISMVKDFSEKLRSAMMTTISASSTVDDKNDRAKIVDKVKKMVFKIGYDDEIINGKHLSLNYFNKLNVNFVNQSYLTSLLTIMKFTTEKHLGNFGKPDKLPYLSATYANAEYLVYYNTISNILASVLYSKGNRPQYLNFGALGTIIAHEMNHAFDLKGKLFDNHGTFTLLWWNPITSTRHWQKLECIEKQYSKFINIATGHQVNGRQTLSENFCDIGGVEVAYKAYYDFSRGKEFALAHFEKFTPLKMFWISLATTWCANPSIANILQRERVDVHAIERIRVNGALMNSKEFAIDWGCKGSLMNPPKKCTVWK